MRPYQGEQRLFVSIVIPVFNSMVLDQLAQRLRAVFAGRPADRYELILVDDGSTREETWPSLQRIVTDDPNARALQLTRNFGQQAATLCGLAAARGEVVVTMDDDLQHAPEDLPLLLERAEWDIVIAQFATREQRWWRRSASWVKGYFDRLLLGVPAGLRLSSYRLLSRAVVDGVLAIRTPRPFLPAMMFHVSDRAIGVPVRHVARAQGASGYTWGTLWSLFSNLLINNSSFLLRSVGKLGVALAAASMVLAAVTIYRALAHRVSVQGWASLFTAIMLIGGLLLAGLGIIGEYLLRIIETSEAKPTYFVRRRIE